MAAAKGRGRHGGRPPEIDPEKLEAIITALNGDATKAAVCRTFQHQAQLAGLWKGPAGDEQAAHRVIFIKAQNRIKMAGLIPKNVRKPDSVLCCIAACCGATRWNLRFNPRHPRPGNVGGGPIPVFQSEEAARAAGDEWLRETPATVARRVRKRGSRFRPRRRWSDQIFYCSSNHLRPWTRVCRICFCFIVEAQTRELDPHV